jgi:erythronate-4-phosphate dehydrogenase
MRIVADRNIPGVAEAFARFGEVVTLSSAEISREAVRDADLLLVRSTVKVGPALLEGSRVRFVATATIGIDHLDVVWLESQGIAWASAPGSNAPSVVQWMAAAMLRAARSLGRDAGTLRVGIVGVGAVGGRLARLLRAISRETGSPAPILCDPPRANAEGVACEPEGLVSLDELVVDADLVTLHVPLTRTGSDATVRLFDRARLASMRRGAVLVNAARGEVVDGEAVCAALDEGHLAAALLDCLPGEPSPPASLVERALVATPHIAGHSLDGKYAGTRLVYEAACAYLGVAPTWTPTLPPAPPLVVEVGGRSTAEAVLEAVRAGYALDDDDAALRKIVALPEGERAAAFRSYRECYPVRRELRARPLTFSPKCEAAEQVLSGLQSALW